MTTIVERLSHLSAEKQKLILSEMAEHLVDSNQMPRLTGLLLSSSEWLEAKATYLNTDSGYVHDLQLVLNSFTDPLPPERMPKLASLVAAQQVVGQRVNAYNNYDLQALVWLNQEDKALAAAQLRTDPKERFDGLLSVYSALKKRGNPAPRLLDEICEFTKQITFNEDKASALRALAICCAEEQDIRATLFFDEAIQATLTINDVLRGPNELYALANALIQFKYFDEAKHVTLSINDDPVRRNRALNALSEALSNNGKEAEAVTIKRLITPEARTAASTHEPKPSAQAKIPVATFNDVSTIAEIPEDNRQARLLEAAVDEALQSGLVEIALSAARAIRISRQRSRALSRISIEIAKSDKERASNIFDEAREAAFATENLPARITVLGRLSAIVENPRCSAELLQIAYKLIDAIPKPLKRASALLVLVDVLLLAHDERANTVTNQARQIVMDAAPSRDRDAELEHLARALTQANRNSEAEAVIKHMSYDFNRANGLTNIGQILVARGDPQASDILKKARQEALALPPRSGGPMNDEQEPASTLSYLAVVLTAAGESDADDYFNKALTAFDGLQDYYSRSIGLTALIESLLEAGRYEDAEEMRRELPIYEMESGILSHEIEALAREKRFEEAIELSKNIQEEQYRRYSLAAIAAQLLQNGYPVQGLGVLGPRTADEYLSVLANYTWPSDKMLFREMLLDCIRITAWVSPFWEQIEQTLSSYR